MRLVFNWLREIVRRAGRCRHRRARDQPARIRSWRRVEHGREPVIDFEITANRPDCLSHLGLAREAAAIWGIPDHIGIRDRGIRDPDAIRDPDRRSDSDDSDPGSRIADPGSDSTSPSKPPTSVPVIARRSSTSSIGPSPDWMRERLEAAGVRPINNVVDVTNYVMLEIGQPMHAFDLERLAAAPHHRAARRRAKRTMRTLDGIDRTLDPDMLVIADAERAVAIGGVMGGANSEISASDDDDRARERVLRADVCPTNEQAAGPEDGSVRAVRARQRRRPAAEGIARAAELFRAASARAPPSPAHRSISRPHAAAPRFNCDRRASRVSLASRFPPTTCHGSRATRVRVVVATGWQETRGRLRCRRSVST